MIPSDEVILGIDLGTTFSLVAYCDERGPHIIRDESGDGRLPSVIGLLAPGRETGGESSSAELLIGWAARKQAIENPLGTIYSIKRLIGKGATDLQRELPYLAYHVQPAARDTLEIEVAGRRYTPQQISALILRELRERAERHLGRTIRKAAITVPAYFDDAQRQATRDAGEAAGLEVVRIINEPTAAALAYGIGLEDNDDKENTNTTGEKEGTEKTRRQAQRGAAQTVAIYDFGGGTFDVSILRIEDGVFQVLATCGDTHLGGDDLDRVLIELVTREVKERFGAAIDAPAIKQALRGLAEALKMQLSDRETARLELDLGKAGVFQREISRAEFEALVGGLVERTLALFDQALRDAKLEKSHLDHFILVGGSTRVPLVRRRVAEHFGRPPYTALNPDEVVALGAAIQGSILAGARPDLLLLDVTPLSLGIETMGGAMGKLILRNTTIPCRATENFTTFVDGQTAIKIHVLQGERELAEHCRSLGEFELRGLPPMPAGIPKVEVEFLIDANGILNVAARELRSGKAASIQIVPNYGLTRAEIEQMTRAGIEHGRADVDAHRRIDLMNQVAFDTAKTEDMLRKFGHRLGAAERERLVDQIARLRALAQTEADLDRLHGALDAFGKSTIGLAELGIREALAQVDAVRTVC